MSKKKVLIVTQEIDPYTALSEISQLVNKLALTLAEKQCEIRILMPRFGTINERRHRLHEVVRLSGMNIIVNDDDYPLIIKVASLPNSRIQVYFLDNDEFFKRKSVFEDSEGQLFDDNLDRMIFFCKSCIEIVRKFGWAPDIIHCHGWMTSLMPLYIKTAYRLDPLFQQSKVIYSLYDTFEQQFSLEQFNSRASINNLTAEDLTPFEHNGAVDLHKGTAVFADGIVKGSEVMRDSVNAMLFELDKPITDGWDMETGAKAVYDFYLQLEAAETVVVE